MSLDTDDDDEGKERVRGVLVQFCVRVLSVKIPTTMAEAKKRNCCEASQREWRCYWNNINQRERKLQILQSSTGPIDSNNNNFVIETERRCIKGSVLEDTDDNDKGDELSLIHI